MFHLVGTDVEQALLEAVVATVVRIVPRVSCVGDTTVGPKTVAVVARLSD
jgi:hypothetical protein